MLLRTMLCAAICEAYRRVASPVAYKDVAGVASGVGCAVDSAVDSARELAGTPRFDGFRRFAKCSGFPTSTGSDSAPVQHRNDSATDSATDSAIGSASDLGGDARSVIPRSISGGNRSDTHTDNSLSRTRVHDANANGPATRRALVRFGLIVQGVACVLLGELGGAGHDAWILCSRRLLRVDRRDHDVELVIVAKVVAEDHRVALR